MSWLVYLSIYGCLNFSYLCNKFVLSCSLCSFQCSCTFPCALPCSGNLRLPVTENNGDGEIRTHDPLLARQVLSQLSYTPMTRMTGISLYRPVSFLTLPSGLYVSTLPDVFLKITGSHLLSRAVSSKVSSAAWVLTVVFGMGTGVSPKRIATGSSPMFLTSEY